MARRAPGQQVQLCRGAASVAEGQGASPESTSPHPAVFASQKMAGFPRGGVDSGDAWRGPRQRLMWTLVTLGMDFRDAGAPIWPANRGCGPRRRPRVDSGDALRAAGDRRARRTQHHAAFPKTSPWHPDRLPGLVSIPGGAAHGFVNVTDAPARQYILITPALDAAAFFTELAGTMRDGVPDQAALNAFGVKWSVEFLGPPLTPRDQPTD